MLQVILAFFGLGRADARSRRQFRLLLRWLAPLIALGLFVYFARFVPLVAAGERFVVPLPWEATVGGVAVSLDLLIDGLSLLFALIVSGIGCLVFLYAGSYMGDDERTSRLFLWLLAFMASMLGLVLSSNLFGMFLFWELTGITSYMLIGFNQDEESSRASALQALLVTGVGGLALMAGFTILAVVGGGSDVVDLRQSAAVVAASPLYIPMIALILLGAFTKSAQFPFHFWLPGAMAAPTPVSAYLHSATMVKAGIFLVARLAPVTGDTTAWIATVTIVGTATALVGGWLAWQQSDLKRILAYSTVSALGMIMALLGVGSPLAVKGALTFLVAHALYKGALFMVAGSVDHGSHTRDVNDLAGLIKKMPWTFAAAAMAAVSLAGLPPTMGFLGKEVVLEAALPSAYGLWLTSALTAASVGFVVVASLVAIRPFFGTATAAAKGAHESPPTMLAGPLVLSATGLCLAFYAGLFGETFISAAMSETLGAPHVAKLALWHGVNTPLLLSAGSFVVGLILYALRGRLLSMAAPFGMLDAIGPAAGYRGFLAGLKWFANAQTRVIQNGRLSIYILCTGMTLITLLGVSWWFRVGSIETADGPRVRLYELMICGMMLAAAIFVTKTGSRLAAICLLGSVGYGISILFLLFAAPDLAMTQLAIETLTVILFVFVLYRLPRFKRYTSTAVRARDALIAIGFGTIMAVLAFSVAEHAIDPSEKELTQGINRMAYPEGRGRNEVNVILVDFRALDTLGEITVLSIAAIGILALLRLRLGEEREA